MEEIVRDERPQLILTARHRMPSAAWLSSLTGRVRPVVVNDGLPAGTEPEVDGVLFLRHAVPLGTGRAVKTALNELLRRGEAENGVLLCSAEGEFAPEALDPMLEALKTQPEKMVMGIMATDEAATPAQKKERKLSSKLFTVINGGKVKEVRPCLRTLPASRVRALAVAPGEEDDYFLNMILGAKEAGLELAETEIPAYAAEYPAMKGKEWLSLTLQLIKFLCSSITAFLVDYAVFTLLYLLLSKSVLLCTVFSRCVSSVYNFLFNKKLVFKASSGGAGQAVKYFLLVAILLGLNVAILDLLDHFLHLPVLLCKPVVELCVYAVSYFCQRDLVFREKKK